MQYSKMTNRAPHLFISFVQTTSKLNLGPIRIDSHHIEKLNSMTTNQVQNG